MSKPPITYSEQALAVVRKTSVVQFFGRATGFIINYTPDHAVRFDLEGRPVEALAQAYRPGEVTLYMGGRKIPSETLGRILNTSPTKPDWLGATAAEMHPAKAVSMRRNRGIRRI
jgi:hypothetical protein